MNHKMIHGWEPSTLGLLGRIAKSLLWARNSRDRKHGLVGEAERSIDCTRSCSHFEPLVKCHVLRVIDVARPVVLHLDRRRCIGQYLDWIAYLQIVLASGRVRGLTRELPDRGPVIEERIVERLAGFMRETGHVLKSGPKDAGRNPARIESNPARLRVCSIFQEIGVKAERAASTGGIGIAGVEVKQERVDAVMQLQQGISHDINHQKIGKTFKVLFDRKEGNYFVGRTEFDSPEVDNEVLVDATKQYIRIGDFATIKITEVSEFDLYGDLV